ncbi:MAG: threonine synthase [Clostridia bacterium]|nr:threonine synthase [Clostridia bacterium]
MIYQSTRNDALTATSAEAILDGMAKDGGLFSPRSLSGLLSDWQSLLPLSTRGMATKILSALLPSFTEDEMAALVERAYENKFETDDLTPTVSVGDDTILELFRGPTSAFKDVALSMLPVLMTAAREKCGVTDEILILTATSGDTGKAAMEGFRDVPGTKIIVFYPHGGVSPVQQAQMATQAGQNVCVCAVRGNFDDAQTGVKRIFAAVEKDDLLHGKGVRLSSANSINIGRLAPQVVYYFRAYADLVQRGAVKPGEPVDFCVPTGNFGDILAGYFAKELGLPVGKLVCASNANNILTDFLRTGVYDRNRPFYKTVSPSMDILVSSNLERLLYLLCDDADTKATIGAVWQQYGYLMDTHTAVAYAVAQQYKAANPGHAPVVILSTASPYKFPAAVLEGLGAAQGEDEFASMAEIERLTGVPTPKNLKTLAERPVRHRDVIDVCDMQSYVLQKAAQKEW